MFKFFTVVILIAFSLLACRPDPGQQHDIPSEMVSEIKQVDKSTIKLPNHFREFFTDFYKDKSLFIKLNKNVQTSPPGAKDLKDKVLLKKKYHGSLTPHQIKTFDEQFDRIKNMFTKIQFIEGKIRAGINENEIDTSEEADANTFEVSLIGYGHRYFGVIELPGDKVLLLYGDRLQVSHFKQNFSLEEKENIHKYQALFTESFDKAYAGDGLLFILGSYMTQRYVFKKNYHILLELNDLVYKGADLFLGDISRESADESRRQSMSKLQEFSSNISHYHEKSFSVLYTDQPELAELSAGSRVALGAAYINQSCVSRYKALWSKPFFRRDPHNFSKMNYGQYILDTHEFSHMFGAQHVYEEERVLMRENITPLKTHIEYILSENIDAIREAKNRVNQDGNCVNTGLRARSLPITTLPVQKDAHHPKICGPHNKVR